MLNRIALRTVTSPRSPKREIIIFGLLLCLSNSKEISTKASFGGRRPYTTKLLFLVQRIRVVNFLWWMKLISRVFIKNDRNPTWHVNIIKMLFVGIRGWTLSDVKIRRSALHAIKVFFNLFSLVGSDTARLNSKTVVKIHFDALFELWLDLGFYEIFGHFKIFQIFSVDLSRALALAPKNLKIGHHVQKPRNV